MDFILDKLGGLTGYLSIALFALLAFRYILKAYFKSQGKTLNKESQVYKNLVKLLALNKKGHPLLGYLTLGMIVIHVYLQTGFQLHFYSTTLTGMAAAGFMTLNVLSGVMGEYVLKKPRPVWWIWVHRVLTLVIAVAILIHIN